MIQPPFIAFTYELVQGASHRTKVVVYPFVFISDVETLDPGFLGGFHAIGYLRVEPALPDSVFRDHLNECQPGGFLVTTARVNDYMEARRKAKEAPPRLHVFPDPGYT